MALVPFTVSARAAILIGRENIANSKGAIIELVKNCYDADSPFCIIYIDNEFCEVPQILSEEQYKKLIRKNIDEDQIKLFYKEKQGEFELVDITKLSALETEKLTLFKDQLLQLCTLYIIDVGDGMTKSIIENHWMTIGTDNKLHNYKTSSGRIKSGAKGIGRFALDKLGAKCEMLTITRARDTNTNNGLVWAVNWGDFEESNKIINDVTANLEEFDSGGLIENVKRINDSFDFHFIASKVLELSSSDLRSLLSERLEDTFSHGTILKISHLHDLWDDNLVKQLFNDLEVLVPPRDTEDFSIHILSTLEVDKYGEVLSSICDDFDYKLTAIADENQSVTITIEREEYDTQIIPSDFFERELVKSSLFASRKEFLKKKYTQTFTFDQLVGESVEANILNQIGSFEFIFYFLKKTTNTSDSKRFFYKPIAANLRKQWLDKFGGVKIYRDNFRVRPYGEVNEPAFDWLGLGSRKGASPAGVAKAEGGYRVEPDNIAGVIKISRLTNLEFEDKSSREGLQETQTFHVFKNIIKSIINKFEEDRSFIARELKHYDDEKFGPERDLAKARKLTESILARNRQKKDEGNSTDSGINDDDQSKQHSDTDGNEGLDNSETKLMALYADSLQEENERLKDEHKLLRGMASSGIISAALGHDLGKIQGKLKSRADKLSNLLKTLFESDQFNGVEEYENPFISLDEIKAADKKILTWLGFSLGFSRKDKRKRKQLSLDSYFEHLKLNWESTLTERGIDFSIESSQKINLRAFEIDFDSIFVNLLTNSMDAFTRPSGRKVSRKIHIIFKEVGNQILIEYRDNGPGLSSSISNPESIFAPLYTTKRDSNGDEVGTGLGMWIAKTVIEEYDGTIKLLLNHINESDTGFGVRISIPVKYKVQEVKDGL